jgi:hypothetical protein
VSMLASNRLSAYSAALGGLALAAPVGAAVQNLPPQLIEAQEDSPGSGLFIYDANIDVDGDGSDDYSVFGFYSTTGGYGYIGLSGLPTGDYGLPYNQTAAQEIDYSYYALPLEDGDPVSGSLDFANFVYLYQQDFFGPDLLDFFEQRGFVGLRFDIPGGSPHFGCVELTVTDVNGSGAPDLQIVGGVFDDVTDTPVTCEAAGVTGPQPLPEPVAVPVNGLVFWLGAFLAGGVMLYSGYRRRKQRA